MYKATLGCTTLRPQFAPPTISFDVFEMAFRIEATIVRSFNSFLSFSDVENTLDEANRDGILDFQRR